MESTAKLKEESNPSKVINLLHFGVFSPSVCLQIHVIFYYKYIHICRRVILSSHINTVKLFSVIFLCVVKGLKNS